MNTLQMQNMQMKISHRFLSGDIMGGLGLLFFTFALTLPTSGGNSSKCDLLQRLEIGKSGIIECSFKDGFYTVAWYTPEWFEKQTPIVRLVNGEKIGEGFVTGEYDIRADGSLIINNVTVLHETNFTAFYFQFEGDEPEHVTVQVQVVVKPSPAFPVLDFCPHELVCYTQLERGVGVSCHISNSRPAVILKWIARTFNGDLNITTQRSIVTEDGAVFTTRAITEDVFLHSSFLSLLVCKADDIPGIMLENESSIFIENKENDLSAMEPINIYAEKYSTLNLECSNGNASLIVWKMYDLHDDTFQVISYAALFENGFSKTNSNSYILQDDGSLLIPRIESEHEGIYGCIYENEETGRTLVFDVTVYVPVRPVVESCTHDQHCVLEGQTEGSLTCSVRGIRPKVQLEWKTFLKKEASSISFTDNQLTISNNGDVYDVTLSSNYRLKDTSVTIISLECVIQHSADVLMSSAKFDLVFASVQPTGESAFPFRRNLLWILVIIIPLCVSTIILCYILKGRRRKQRPMRQEFDHEQGMPMMQAESSTDLKTVFKRELKTKYKYQYDAVQPIPYIKDRLYCVDRVFVEGGFEKLISRDEIVGLGNWVKLKSYHEVTDMSSSSSRTIIEGDPGYGKSTFTLQLAYDWCNSSATSPLAGVDILILLRLRQLGGVWSLYKAIKQFLLPRDSRLSDSDIESILQQSRSPVVILDGFDEYPEEETGDLTHFFSIIRGEMFQEGFVILTTRSFYLPKSFPPQSHRIRLTGFDEKARDAYIRKAVVGDNIKAAEKIKKSLEENSVLKGLCQVPLFFVMFAHMTHESETFLKFNSVTSFFKYMIVCFHSHMKNKMKDANVQEVDLHELNHASLDEVAFQALSGKNQKIVWTKSNLVQRLGIEFYTQYRRIGILVEEEVLDITDKPGDIEYSTEVRFYHKLFCEWYAAHHLCRKVVEPEADLPKLLENMNPFDLQYTYRFACGLNSEAGNKIIQYLRDMEAGDKFAVLCLLEQSGNFDQIKETVQDLCSSYITIDKTDSLLLQGSIVQLLEIGSSNQIPISYLWLQGCFNSVDLSARSILLKSKLSIPSLPTLKELVIGERDRKITTQHFTDVLKYSAMCSELKRLRFCYLLMPKSISTRYCSLLYRRKIEVSWGTDDGDYLLNHRTGEWKACDPRSSDVFEGDISAKMKLLISLMKKTYKEKTSAVPVIPRDHDRLYKVNEIYVDGGLQCLVAKGKDKSGRQWEPIASYRNIFTGGHVTCKRYILQGNPGFGKSIVALQMASDWCNDNHHSPLSKMELFLLVHFKIVDTSKSIFAEIRRNVLPKDSPLSDVDIRNILHACSSAVMVLDGFNLYAYGQADENCDINQIIQGKMFKDVDVVTTCTYVPKECLPGTTRLRLSGFDERARDEYIRKVLTGNDAATARKITQQLRSNHVLEELCNVPMFFTTFTQLSKQCNELPSVNTVLTCITEYWRGQIEEDKHDEFDKDHLDRVAFECLSNSHDRFALEKETIYKTVGRECCDKYLRLGILSETGTVTDSDILTQSSSTKAQFCHDLICKWFAASYIAKHAMGRESEQIQQVLKKVAKPDIEHIRTFLAEIDVGALGRVLYWVLYQYDFDELTELALEYFDQAGSFTDVVSTMCSRAIEFNTAQNQLRQISRIRLLHMTSTVKISISEVWLRNCFSTVDMSGGNHLELKSNLFIPVLSTLQKLTIDTYEEDREITADEFAGILQYSSKCRALKVLRFWYCLLPQSVPTESFSVLRSRNVEVFWYPTYVTYQLNPHFCLWEQEKPFGGGQMTDKDYQKEVKKFREIRERKERRERPGHISR